MGRSSAQAPNPPVARPPRPARPVPVVQGVKRKEMVTDSSEQRSEKSRREELLEMALLNSGRNLSPSSTRMSTFGPAGSPAPSHSVPKQLQGTGTGTIATVLMPAGISSVTAKVVKGSSPLQKLQVQRKPPLAPKPPLTVNSNSPSQQSNIKPAVTSNLQTSLNPKQIEALLSAPSIGSPTLRQASPAGTTSIAGPVTPKGSQADFSFASSGKGENTPMSLNISLDSKRTSGADSPGCNFSLECEVCKTQVSGNHSLKLFYCSIHYPQLSHNVEFPHSWREQSIILISNLQLKCHHIDSGQNTVHAVQPLCKPLPQEGGGEAHRPDAGKTKHSLSPFMRCQITRSDPQICRASSVSSAASPSNQSTC